MVLRFFSLLPFLIASAISAEAATTSRVVDVPAGDVKQRFLHVKADAPKASIIALQGGDGVLNIQDDGTIAYGQALCSPMVRNRNAFGDQGFSVALVDADSSGAVYNMTGILEVIRYMQREQNIPVWILGTSAAAPPAARVSADYSGFFRGGVVLVSPDKPATNVLTRITQPAQVVFHSADTGVAGTATFFGLTSTTQKEQVVFTGGSSNGCTYHLLQGLDTEFVSAVTTFVSKYNPNVLRLTARTGVDIDANGRGEVVIRSNDGRMQVGQFSNNLLQFSAYPDPGTSYRLVATADVNGDGRTDLVFQNVTQGVFGDIKVWPNFASTGEIFWRQVKQVWDVQAVGDMDGDGVSDLVWRYVVPDSPDTGVSYIWFSNGSAVTQVRKRGGAPLSWQLLGAIDLNGDGAADLLYLSPDGQIKALMATPNRTCANVSAGSIPVGYSALRLADFSGRGRGDILIRDGSGQIQLVQLDGSGLVLPPYTGAPDDQNAACTPSSLTVANNVVSLPNISTSWTFYASADLNGDGTTDIIWRQPDGTLTVWLMNIKGAAPTIIPNAGSAPAGFTVFQSGGPTLQ